MKEVILALASLLLASLANANPRTIDPNGLTEGTDLSNAYWGVTLRHLTIVNGNNGAALVADHVYAKECPTTSDPDSECSALGSGHFGYQTASGAIAGNFSAESSSSISCVTSNPRADSHPMISWRRRSIVL